MSNLDKILRNVEIVEPKEELTSKLEASEHAGKPLRIKLGFDPTAPDLHLGHAVVLKKLRDFQDLGHTVVVVIGDYTARIGDPTGKNESRPPLTKEEVNQHAETYLKQLGLVIDLHKVEIVHNSQWFEEKDFADSLTLSAQFTLAQILQRKDFRTRYEEGKPVHMHEIMYPMMQGQDSVEIQADVEIGGTDQLFNCLFGRDLQKIKGLEAQVVICMPLLPGTDGTEKMSKSKGNYVALTDEPENMYGKIMSISDSLLPLYLRLLTNFEGKIQKDYIEQLEQERVNPMIIKKLVARDITTQFHGNMLALQAEQAFERNVQMKSFDASELPQLTLNIVENSPISLEDFCITAKETSKLDMSNNQLRRLIHQGGISLDDQKLTDANQVIYPRSNMILKIGKRTIFSLRIKESESTNSDGFD